MQDLEIIKDYVPGYDNVLGHEFVGRVESCKSRPDLIGKRVIGEINCPLDADFRCVFQVAIAFLTSRGMRGSLSPCWISRDGQSNTEK